MWVVVVEEGEIYEATKLGVYELELVQAVEFIDINVRGLMHIPMGCLLGVTASVLYSFYCILDIEYIIAASYIDLEEEDDINQSWRLTFWV